MLWFRYSWAVPSLLFQWLSSYATLLDPNFDNLATGKWNGSFFEYTVTRRNLQDGCVTQMFGRLIVSSQDSLKVEITGSDGRCDLPQSFTESSTWFKN
jgi:hypothetical protein